MSKSLLRVKGAELNQAAIDDAMLTFTHSLTQYVKEQIEAMAEAVVEGPAGPRTLRGTVHIVFGASSDLTQVSYGEHIQSESVPNGNYEDLAARVLDSIQRYRDTFSGPVDLVWRRMPAFETREDGRRVFTLRMCFEPHVATPND